MHDGRELSDKEASELIANLESTIDWCSDELLLEGVYAPKRSKQYIIEKMLSVSKRLGDALDGLFYTPEGDEVTNFRKR